MRKTVMIDGVKLPYSTDERAPIMNGNFKNFSPERNNNQRVLLIAAWLKVNRQVGAPT